MFDQSVSAPQANGYQPFAAYGFNVANNIASQVQAAASNPVFDGFLPLGQFEQSGNNGSNLLNAAVLPSATQPGQSGEVQALIGLVQSLVSVVVTLVRALLGNQQGLTAASGQPTTAAAPTAAQGAATGQQTGGTGTADSSAAATSNNPIDDLLSKIGEIVDSFGKVLSGIEDLFSGDKTSGKSKKKSGGFFNGIVNSVVSGIGSVAKKAASGALEFLGGLF